jgi:hypothetical protein
MGGGRINLFTVSCFANPSFGDQDQLRKLTQIEELRRQIYQDTVSILRELSHFSPFRPSHSQLKILVAVNFLISGVHSVA